MLSPVVGALLSPESAVDTEPDASPALGMPADFVEVLGKLALPALGDGPEPEGMDADEVPAELLGEPLDELDEELRLSVGSLLDDGLLDDEPLGSDTEGGVGSEGVEGVVGMLALGHPVSMNTVATRQQACTAR